LDKEAKRPISISADTPLGIYDFLPDEKVSVSDTVAERLKNIHAVKEVMESFRNWSTKFKFGTTSRETWEKKYKFSNSNSTFESHGVVNSSEESVRSYINHVVSISSEPRPAVIMLLGDIGAGKSSFNKYFTTVYHDELKSVGVIACRIECQKLHKHLGVYSDLPKEKVANAFILGNLMRDIALYAFGKESYGKGSPFDLSSGFKLTADPSLVGPDGRMNEAALSLEILELAEGPDYSPLGITSALVSRFFKQFHRYPVMMPPERSGFVAYWAKYFLFDNPDSKAMAAIAELFVKRVFQQYRAFIIFDGFDYIDVNDVLDDSLLNWSLNWLSDLIIEKEGYRLPISGERLNSFTQISIRKSTNEIFWQRRSASHSQVNYVNLWVETPTVKSVIEGLVNLIDHFAPNSSDLGAVWADMLSRSVDKLYSWLRQPGGRLRCDFSPAELFQNNSRHLVNFLRDVIELELDSAHKRLLARKSDINTRTLANEMRDNFDDIVSHRSYALVQILLSSRSARYQNFLSVRCDKDGCLILEDNDNGSGYIGNPFNYHANYSSVYGLREFTHKLVILSNLCETNQAKSVEEIANMIGQGVDFAATSIHVMLRENMIEPVYNSARKSVLYRVSKLGAIIFDHLIEELSYVESIFFGMSIPAVFIDSELQDVHRSDAALKWVNGSFANVTLVLRMIQTAADASDEKYGRSRLREIHQRMLESFERAFQRIAHGGQGQPMLTASDVSAIFTRQRAQIG
jgi:hypothetical protein